jgi:hypothetical protein
MTLVCPVFDRINLLPYFIKYYEKIGVTRFIFAVWNAEVDLVSAIKERFVKHSESTSQVYIYPSFFSTKEEYNGVKEHEALCSIISNKIPYGEWYMIADMDEFHVFTQPIPELIKLADTGQFDAIGGELYDRVSVDEFPKRLDYSKTLDSQFPYVSDITRVVGANDRKVALIRGGTLPGLGHHAVDEPTIHNSVLTHHFKWTHGIVNRLHERKKNYTKQGLPWAGESATILEVLENQEHINNGMFNFRLAQKIGV